MMSPKQLRNRLVGAGIQRAYELGKVPAIPAAPYVVISVGSGTPETYSLAGGANQRYSLTVQVFGSSLDAVRDLCARADVALHMAYLDEVPGEPECRRTLATQPRRDPDGESLLYVLHVYQYGADQ